MVFTPRKIRSDAIVYRRRDPYDWINAETDCFNIYNLYTYLKSRRGVNVICDGTVLERGGFAMYYGGNAYRKNSSQTREERQKLEEMPDLLFHNQTDVITRLRTYLNRADSGIIGVYVSNLQHSVTLYIRRVNGVNEFLCYDPSNGMPQHDMIRSFVNELDNYRCTVMRYCQNVIHGNVTAQCSMDAFDALSKTLLLGFNPFDLNRAWTRVIDNPRARQWIWRHDETGPGERAPGTERVDLSAFGIVNGEMEYEPEDYPEDVANAGAENDAVNDAENGAIGVADPEEPPVPRTFQLRFD